MALRVTNKVRRLPLPAKSAEDWWWWWFSCYAAYLSGFTRARFEIARRGGRYEVVATLHPDQLTEPRGKNGKRLFPGHKQNLSRF